jgi:O-methyltransferase
MKDQSVIFFDDYGGRKYTDTKDVVDKFFSDKPGIMLHLTNGRSVYFLNKKNHEN